MITKHKARFVKNVEAKKINVTKEIDATIEEVWDAWTTAEQLDKWWGPKPWNAVTKKMNFTEGGTWLYYMEGPKGEKQWSKSDFIKIKQPEFFSAKDAFIDEKGNKNPDMPSMHWQTHFTKKGDGTKMEIDVLFDTKEDMDKILKTGFEEGFSTGLDQLDELLSN